MKKYLFFAFISFYFSAQAQQKLLFNYDQAGNQILRELCLSGCPPTSKHIDIKEIEELMEQDLLKFSPGDVISYYPNPVKEELYLQWELMNQNSVTSIQVYSMIGQVLRTYQINEGTNALNIPFQDYATGVYLVVLSYKDGGEKSIKIIKQ